MKWTAPREFLPIGAWILAALLALAAPAFAVGASVTYAGTLVRGGAPMPQFQLAFPDTDSGKMANFGGNLQIDVTSPDKSVYSFLFSPRPQWGSNYNAATGTTSSTAGFTWNDRLGRSRFYGGFGLVGSVLNPGADDVAHRFQGSSPALYGTVHFGYELSGEQDLFLSYDRARTMDFTTDRGELGDNLRLNYGVKF